MTFVCNNNSFRRTGAFQFEFLSFSAFSLGCNTDDCSWEAFSLLAGNVLARMHFFFFPVDKVETDTSQFSQLSDNWLKDSLKSAWRPSLGPIPGDLRQLAMFRRVSLVTVPTFVHQMQRLKSIP